MLRLHFAPDNASLIIRIALEELGLAYETRLVDRAASAQKSATYRALNPRGQIPVLETPDGPMFETAAILLWLSETAGALAPPPGAPDRGAFLSWMFALSNGVHRDLRGLFYPARYVGDAPETRAMHRAMTVARLNEALDRLEDLAQAGHGWFCADAPSATATASPSASPSAAPTDSPTASPSVLDIYLAVMMRWMAIYPEGETGWFHPDARPALQGLAARLEARPAVQRAAGAEGLGPAPLTAPRPCAAAFGRFATAFGRFARAKDS